MSANGDCSMNSRGTLSALDNDSIVPTRVFGDVDQEDADVQLDVGDTVAGGGAHDRDLLVDGLGCHGRDRLRADDSGGQGAVDADDVGLARGDG